MLFPNRLGYSLDQFNLLRTPGGWLPRVAEVDRLAHDLAVAELHDVDRVHRPGLVVIYDVLGHPEIATAPDALGPQRQPGRISVPHRAHVDSSDEPLTALRELQHHVVVVDLVHHILVIDI